jgi:5-methylthioadenosine/S-adenosylhomocysteine deaminase
VTPALTLIRNAVVIPVAPAGVYDRGWVRLAGGTITAVGPGEPDVAPGDVVLDARGDLLLPGFVSSHQHLLDVLLRGGPTFGPDFLEWLLGIYYGGIVHYSPNDAGLATYLAGVETLLAGVTTVVDNWGVNCGGDRGRSRAAADCSLESYRRLGLRVVFGRMFATQLPEEWIRRPLPYEPGLLTAPLDECLADISALMGHWDGAANGRIRVTPAPELVEMVGLDGVRATRELAEAHGVKMPIHLLTSPDSRAQHPAKVLAAAGVLGESVLAAHCTAATGDDLNVLRQHGVSVAHCPTSSAFFGAALSVRRFTDAGLCVGLGSDNATLNCNSDLLAEARHAALNAHLLDSFRPRLSGWEALRLATLGGAEAAGLDHQIGSIEPGKKADLTLVDVSGPHWYPRHDWAEALLFQGRAADVRTVLVDGVTVVDDRRLTSGDYEPGEALGAAAQRASERIREQMQGAS